MHAPDISLWSELRSPRLLPFGLPSQGNPPWQNGRSGGVVYIAGLTPRAHDKEEIERRMTGIKCHANEQRKKNTNLIYKKGIYTS